MTDKDAAPDVSHVREDDLEVLRRGGYSDAEIAAMDPVDVATSVDEILGPPEWMKTPAPPERTNWLTRKRWVKGAFGEWQEAAPAWIYLALGAWCILVVL